MTLTIDDIQKIVDVIDKKLDEKLDLKLDSKLKEYTRHLATKEDIKDVREEIKILRSDDEDLKENTVKYDDIADLFEGFEERIKDQILPMIKENKVNIEMIKEHLKI